MSELVLIIITIIMFVESLKIQCTGFCYFIDALYRIDETNSPQRFYFDNQLSASKTGSLLFHEENATTCTDVDIYIMVKNECEPTLQ